MAIQLARDLEPFPAVPSRGRLAPEDLDYFRLLRPQTSTPLAMGELFVGQADAANLHLDVATNNFGIQESHLFGERTR